ncbi:hypothetical protein IWX91DRAFT_93522 [Phyllosticta citricarpa]
MKTSFLPSGERRMVLCLLPYLGLCLLSFLPESWSFAICHGGSSKSRAFVFSPALVGALGDCLQSGRFRKGVTCRELVEYDRFGIWALSD